LYFRNFLPALSLKIFGSAPADISFIVTSTDTLSIDSNKHIACSNVAKTKIDKTSLDAATVLLFIFFPFATPWALDAEQQLLLAESEDPAIPASVRCFLGSVIPSTIPVCCGLGLSGNKLSFSYSRLLVDDTGVHIGGIWAIVKRTPKVEILATCVPSENSTYTQYSISTLTSDLLPNLKYSWTLGGKSLSASASLFQTWKVGSTNSISVTVTDVDLLTGTASKSIKSVICPEKTSVGGPAPVVCHNKPWTPGC